MHAGPEGRQHAQSPVAQLVAETLHDDLLVGRHEPLAGLALVVDVGAQVDDAAVVEPALFAQRVVRRGVEVGHELADLAAELDRSPRDVGLPERHLAGHARSRRDDDLVAGDVFDAPRSGTEQEGLADAGLEDHFFVELADPGVVRREHAVQAAVRDGAAADDRQHARRGTRRDRVGGAVPGDARLELGELVGRVTAAEHVEHAVEGVVGDLGVGIRVARHGTELGDRHRFGHGADGLGHDLLGEHVERDARHARRLDSALLHGGDGDGADHEVAAELGEDAAAAGDTNLVAGASDALQAAGDARRRLHAHDEVDRSHVDPEFERRRAHQRRDRARLQRVFDFESLLAGDRPVVGASELLVGQFVDRRGDALSQPAVVDEHQGRLVGADQLQQFVLQRRPNAVARFGTRGDLGVDNGAVDAVEHRLAELRHVFDRHHDLDVELFRHVRVDDGHRPELAVAQPAEELADFFQRPLRRAQPDALERRAFAAHLHDELFEALQRERQVRAALGAGHRVDLVNDHDFDTRQGGPRLARQQEIERLRRGDEHVGRMLYQGAAFVGRGIAGAGTDADVGQRQAGALGLDGDAGERRLQVALDVVGQRLERADVQHAAAALLVGRRRLGGEPVERPQERRQGLAGTRGRGQQHVLALRDGVPPLLLGGRRRDECAREPGPGGA